MLSDCLLTNTLGALIILIIIALRQAADTHLLPATGTGRCMNKLIITDIDTDMRARLSRIAGRVIEQHQISGLQIAPFHIHAGIVPLGAGGMGQAVTKLLEHIQR